MGLLLAPRVSVQLMQTFVFGNADEGLERAFPGAAGALATEQASENVGWADVRIQATAADPQTGEERVFELTFGVPGRDGLPVRVSGGPVERQGSLWVLGERTAW